MTLAALLTEAGNGLEQLRSLPWIAHALMGAVLISGLILWLIGRKILKPLTVVVFMLLFGAMGFFLPPIGGLGEWMSVYMGLAVGLGVGAILGILLYRFAMAVGFGLVLGIGAPLVALVIIDRGPAPAASPLTPDQQLLSGVPVEGPDRISELRDQVQGRLDHLSDSMAEKLAPPEEKPTPDSPPADPKEARNAAPNAAVRNATQRVQAFMEAAGGEARQEWDTLSAREQLVLAGSALGGLALGVFAGLLLPKWAAGAVTAMLGGAMWLAAFTWLSGAMNASWHGFLEHGSKRWLIGWCAVSALGMIIQWSGLVKRKAKPKEE